MSGDSKRDQSADGAVEDVDQIRQLRDLEREAVQTEKQSSEQIRSMSLGMERRICELIQQLREERGWSQAELARVLGRHGFDLHQTTIAKLEAGKRPLRVAELWALANVFGIPAASFFYLPFKGEPYSVEFMRDRLAALEEAIQEAEEQFLSVLRVHAQTYAEYSVARYGFAEAIRDAVSEKGERNGVDPEA